VGATLAYYLHAGGVEEAGRRDRPSPRYLVQDLAARSDLSVLISSVAHPELNPIVMVWGTVKMALKRANTSSSLATLRSMAEVEFVNITAGVWAK